MFNISVTDNVKKVIDNAGKLAYTMGEQQVGTEHLLYGLSSVTSAVASRILQKFGVTANELAGVIRQTKAVSRNFYGNVEIDYTPRVKDIFRAAQQIAYEMGQPYIVTEQLLYALLLDETSQAITILSQYFNVNIQTLRSATLRIIKGTTDASFTQNSANGGREYANNGENYAKNGAKGAENYNAGLPEVLRDMGVDMTARARAGKMDPIIGREKETARIIEILCRKTKNNPVLIGEAWHKQLLKVMYLNFYKIKLFFL